ncbi:hypothetical protein ACNKHO_24285 [Shigella flexneri]
MYFPYKAVLETLLLEAYSWDTRRRACWQKILNSACTTGRSSPTGLMPTA